MLTLTDLWRTANTTQTDNMISVHVELFRNYEYAVFLISTSSEVKWRHGIMIFHIACDYIAIKVLILPLSHMYVYILYI